MQDNKAQSIPSQELPTCQVCSLQPTPQTVQHLPFIILQFLMLFYSYKLALALLAISYCFGKNNWYCPQCKRQIIMDFEVQGSNDNIVLRIGNCMIMLAKSKFRVIASLVIAFLLYSFITGIKNESKPFHVEKNWVNLANNCGYQAYLENQFRANSIYNEYPKLGEWTIQGIFLRQTPNVEHKFTRIYVKMDPSQFKNGETEDIVVYETEQTKSSYTNRQIGDVVRFVGQWEGRQGQYYFRFVATKLQSLGTKADLENIKVISSAQKFIKAHDNEQKHLSQGKIQPQESLQKKEQKPN